MRNPVNLFCWVFIAPLCLSTGCVSTQNTDENVNNDETDADSDKIKDETDTQDTLTQIEDTTETTDTLDTKTTDEETSNCGTSTVDLGEDCDDGNITGGDGCDADCKLEEGFQCPVPGKPCEECGDGVLDLFEDCDDGNRNPGDGCSEACTVEPGWDCGFSECVAADCGDGVLAGGEECDDGNRTPGDGCSYLCRLESGHICVTPGFPCRETVCGDSAVEGDEACDDGGTQGGDGCDSHCQLESGYHCPVPGIKCEPTTCGDGKRQGLEQCDDNNAEDGDGCSGQCRLEQGFRCPSEGESCKAATCPNGKVEGLEGCDDGNDAAGDGCAADCTVEPLFKCAGSPSECEPVTKFVAIAEFPAPMQNTQAVYYDPSKRSFVASGFYDYEDNAEVCLDGTFVGTNTRSRYGVGSALDGATYDPFNNRYLFIQQSGLLTEVDRDTDQVVQTLQLNTGRCAAGVAIGEDGRLYVPLCFDQKIYVFDRSGGNAVQIIDAPHVDPWLDQVFMIPGENMIGRYNWYPGDSGRQFIFNSYDGALVGRSEIPGIFFANGRPFPMRVDGVEASPDGGFFLACSEYLDYGDGTEDGICQLFSRSCATDVDCTSRIPGTACKLDAQYPYCYAPVRARDDSYSVGVNAQTTELDVLKNDTIGDGVCHGEEVEITSVSTGDQGGIIELGPKHQNVLYKPAKDFCGAFETFTYEAALGGESDQAKVTVFVACVCGDGIIQQGESCDDGNRTPEDGCDANCQIEPECGDGRLDDGEQCDDGNTLPGDGCSPNCTNEAVIV